MTFPRVFGFVSLMLLCLTLSSCAALQSAMASQASPSARVTGLKVRDLSASSLNLVADVEVTNTLPIPIYSNKLSFQVLSDGAGLVSGESDRPINVGARSTATVPIAVKLPYSDIINFAKGAKLGSIIPVTMKVDLSLIGENIPGMSYSIEKTGEVPLPAPPEVKLTGVNWSELGLSGAKGVIGLEVVNTNEFPLSLGAMGYGINLGGRRIAAGELLGRNVELTPGLAQPLQIDFEMKPSDLGLSALSMLKKSEFAYEIDGNLEMGSQFGPLTLPYSKRGEVKARK